MRITFVIPFINLTGGIRAVFDYANWLHDAGHQVTVVYPAWPYRFALTRRQQVGEFKRQLFGGAPIPWLPLRCRLLRVPAIRTRFLPAADLVIATSWPTAHDVARLHPSRGTKVHLLMHHETGTGSERRIRAIYRLPLRRICFSRLVRDHIEREFACAVDEVVPTAIDPNVFFPDGAQSDRSVLMLYHPDPRKGAGDGIEAFSRVRARRPDILFHLCGTVRPEALPPWLTFEFHPVDAMLRRRYAAAAAFVYPSRYEGFGLPPLEAMACGCPVVTTRVGAVPEFARHRDNALVTEPREVSAIASGIDELLEDDSLRQTLIRGGLETARAFTLERIGPLFETALKRIVGATC